MFGGNSNLYKLDLVTGDDAFDKALFAVMREVKWIHSYYR